MSKAYKVWAEIEEYDSVSGKYRNITEEGIAEPVPIGVFNTLEEAVAFTEGLDYLK